jgi:hypothetical protein
LGLEARVKPRDLIRMRLVNQHLARNPAATVEAVVGELGAMQSQEFAVAKWSIGQRLGDRVLEADIDRAFAEGRILRTHVLRPTWHFVQAADYRWILALSGPRVHAANVYPYRRFELDSAIVAKSVAILEKVLRGGKHLTRAEVAECFARRGIVADGLRLGYLMMHAELDAVITSGVPKGKQQTYALVDERVHAKKERWSKDQALGELVRRYFGGHGPATVRDFSWWSGFTLAEVKRGLEIVGKELERLDVEGRTYWRLASSRAAAGALKLDEPIAHLLQVYDEFGIAYSESRDLLNLSKRAMLVAPLLHTTVIDGQLAGHWRRQGSAIETQLYAPLRGKKARAFEVAREAYQRFFTAPREGSPASPRRRR